MIKAKSSQREFGNLAIRLRVSAVSSFDAHWYLATNNISEVPICKAWSHYRSVGQARGHRARYDVGKLVRTLLQYEFSYRFYNLLQDQLKKGEAAAIYFYPQPLGESNSSCYRLWDPFYIFAEEFCSLLREQDAYRAILGLRLLLAGSSTEMGHCDGSSSLQRCLEACLLSGYRAIDQRRERFGDHWRGDFIALNPDEIRAAKLCFDANFYCGVYPDIRLAEIDPLDHFLGIGRLECRQATPIFDPLFYLDTNPDVEAASVDPFVHYIIHGWREKRDPSESFSHGWLLQVFPEATKHPNGFCGYLSESISGEQRLEILHNSYNSNSNPDYRQQPVFQAIAGVQDIGRIFAFYLTQYHPIAQNDFAWGKGFTEWRNVTKAFPRFFGHYQPKLPSDSTFYDLRLKQNIHDQIELARRHGVNGFCFYYYWFSGDRVLEQPLDLFLQEKDLASFPFCILWANENWTRKWDGLSKDVIIGQKYSQVDQLQFIRDVEPLLLDSRYERVNGAPLLIVYRPDDLPDCRQWVATWREYWRRQGHGELHLACVQFMSDTNPRDYGFDAMLQFPPNGFPNHGTHHKISTYTQKFKGNLFSYDEMQWRALLQQYDHAVYRTSVPSWDNESRRSQQGDIFVGSSPAKFRDWTAANLLNAHQDNPAGICFVNAWNEWAESACLEPDSRYGYAHLEGLADARTIATVQKEAQTWTACHSAAIVVHVFYLDSFNSISSYLQLYSGDCDLYFTLPPLSCHEKVFRIRERFPQARIFITENRGRDVRPFLSLIRHLRSRGISYRELCKLHTKKSPHRRDGAAWLDEMLHGLLPVEGLQRVKTLLKGQVGMLIPEGHAVNLWEFMGGNESLLDLILTCHHAQHQNNSSSYFSSGTMFWIRGEVLENLSEDDQIYSFEYERGQIDGTLAHAWERAFALLVRSAGLSCRQTDGCEVVVAAPGIYRFADSEGRVDLGEANRLHTAGVECTLQLDDDSPQQRVALLATFVRDERDMINVRQICSYLRANGYFTTAINPGCDYTSEIREAEVCSYLNCDFYIKRRNSGYDFGSWAEGFFLLKQRGILDAARTEELLIINDSCYLVDIASDLIHRARAIGAGVVGLTDSYQFRHHLQSNFLLFRPYQCCESLLEQFFDEYLNCTLRSKDDFIRYGELALAEKLNQAGICIQAVYETRQLIALTRKKYSESPAASWEGLTLSMLDAGYDLNPHNYLHEVLYLDLCCPLIKKQFIQQNPGGQPNMETYKQLVL